MDMNNWEVGQKLKEYPYKNSKVGIKQIKQLENRFNGLLISLSCDPPLEGYLSLDNLPIKVERFTPKIKKSIDIQNAKLYARLARAFHCKLVWTEEFYPEVNTNHGIIKTFDIWGPEEMIPYVGKAINLIHTTCYLYKSNVARNLSRNNRIIREKSRSGGKVLDFKVDTIKQSRLSYFKFVKPYLNELEDRLGSLSYYKYYPKMNERVERHIINRSKLDYKLTSLFSNRKYIEDVTARKNHFHKNRVVNHG